MIRRILERRPGTMLAWGALLTATIAYVDWQVEFNATLGFLYIFPMVLLGVVLEWWQLMLAAIFCTFLSDRLDPFPMDSEYARDALIFLSLTVTAFLSWTVTRGYRGLQEEATARRAAEEQLEFLIASSPAAVLTMTAQGEILLANPAAHKLLGVSEGKLPGRRIARYIPALGWVPSLAETEKIFRTEMQTRGQRESGEVFLADVFFSTYTTAAGPRLAALVVDSSEHLREREEASLEQLLAGSRVLVAAVSHEVRNVSGAIRMVHENLARGGTLTGNHDFEALGTLVQTLSKIASLELKQSTSRTPIAQCDLRELLTDLRIVLEPSCEEADISLAWDIPGDLPLVQADRHSLLQVLLNLTKNSQRALESVGEKRIRISVVNRAGGVMIRVADSGPGITQGQKLFQPLQKGADATGLGLYLSRAFMRSFRGDLRHDPDHAGCCFVLDLAAAGTGEDSSDTPALEHATNPAPIA